MEGRRQGCLNAGECPNGAQSFVGGNSPFEGGNVLSAAADRTRGMYAADGQHDYFYTMRNRILPYNRNLKPFARKLRQQGILSEVILWKELKGKAPGVEFHRQVPIDNYVVDFYCHELKLAVEIDGATHKDGTVAANDKVRQARLESLGVRFIRFDDADVRFDTLRVVASIQAAVDALHG